MKYLFKEVDTEHSESIRVDLTGNAANVMVMDSASFSNYKAGRRFNYLGGYYKQSPAIITPPHAGRWFVVINLGGYAGNLSASIAVL